MVSVLVLWAILGSGQPFLFHGVYTNAYVLNCAINRDNNNFYIILVGTESSIGIVRSERLANSTICRFKRATS